MTRQRTLYVVATLTIIVGLLWGWSFFSPLLDSSKVKVLNPVLIIISVSFLLTGLGLFRLNEFALEIGFWSWFLSLMGSLLSLVFMLPANGKIATSNRLPAIIFVSAWIIMNLFVTIFLGQEKTKKRFVSESKERVVEKTRTEQELKP